MKTACVILAAGLGTRMKSPLPKVLHEVCGMPMLESVVDTARKLKPERIIVVAGRQIELIRNMVSGSDVFFAVQKEPLGTGHALKCALPFLKGFKGTVVVLNGDTPLITASSTQRFLSLHRKDGNDLSVLSFISRNPAGYGRIVRDGAGGFLAIVEEKNADARQKKIGEVNSGIYAMNHTVLHLVGRIRINRVKGEYYLTDIVGLSLQGGFRASAYPVGEEQEFMGVNTRDELSQASRLMRERIIRTFMEKGVSFLDPSSVMIHPHAVLGEDTTIYPNVCIEGDTRVGRHVTIYPNVRIRKSLIGDHAVVMDSSVIEESLVREGARVGPFAHVRPGSEVGKRAKIGNFVELKKAVIGEDTKASHLSYLGDAVIGRNVNVGAGTITCNFDGRRKHRTVIGDNVFIGSDSQLVAPVSIGSGAYVGAGSTITKDVPSGALAVGRAKQRNIRNWAKKRQAEVEADGKLGAKAKIRPGVKMNANRKKNEG